MFKLKKKGVYSFRLCYSLLAYSCIKYAITNVIWAALNVIMCDTMSTRWATELKGDFDKSYLTKQSYVTVRSGSELGGIKQVCVSKNFDLLLLLTGMNEDYLYIFIYRTQ